MTATAALHVTRCPVPTASGVAVSHGWLPCEPALADIDIRILQDLPELRGRHFDHRLDTLVREGGNIPALWAAARDGRTRLLGLTWVDEFQALVGRPGGSIGRIGIPVEETDRVDFRRATALKGVASTLAKVGAGLDGADLVEIAWAGHEHDGEYGAELQAVGDGAIDAFFVKGAQGHRLSERAGVEVLVELTADDPLTWRVNNGTPRTLTAHADLVESAPQIVDAYVRSVLAVSRWAHEDQRGFFTFVAQETGTDLESACEAYDLSGLTPSLSDERLDALRVQRDFLVEHGFIASGLDLDDWIHPTALNA